MEFNLNRVVMGSSERWPMAEQLFELPRQFFDAYGYWTLVFFLMLDNAGISLDKQWKRRVETFP
jgi:hypothetical protein